MNRFILSTFMLLYSLCSIAQAEENKTETNETETNKSSSFNIDFTLNLGIAYQKPFYFGNRLENLDGEESDTTAAIGLSIDAEYHRFFLESNSKSRVGGVLGRDSIGYHLWRDENTIIDIISGNYVPAIKKTTGTDGDGDPIPELQNLNKRLDDYNVGFRYSQLKNDWYISTEVVNDILNESHKSFVVESYIGQAISKGNWDLIYGFGHTWYSSKVSNYYVGLQENEIVNDWSSYQTGAAYTLNFEFSAEYPVSKNWVFQGAFAYRWFSENIRSSPLVISDYSLNAFVGFGYVF